MVTIFMTVRRRGSLAATLGWHQLSAQSAARLVSDAALPHGSLVVDIGAGTGAITRPLVDAGHQVVAVELHPGRARQLEQRFGSRITVVRADASDLRLPRRPFHVVANPPLCDHDRRASTTPPAGKPATDRTPGPPGLGGRPLDRTGSARSGPLGEGLRCPSWPSSPAEAIPPTAATELKNAHRGASPVGVPLELGPDPTALLSARGTIGRVLGTSLGGWLPYLRTGVLSRGRRSATIFWDTSTPSPATARCHVPARYERDR